MALTRKFKIYAALLALGGGALAADRLGGGAGAGPGGASPAASVPRPAGPARPGAAPPQATPPARPGGADDLADFARRLREAAGREGARAERADDAFRPPAAWVPAPRAAAPAESRARAERFSRDHRLKAVLVNARGGYAIVDGRCLPVGRPLDGFTLASVAPGSATFVADPGAAGAARAELKIDLGPAPAKVAAEHPPIVTNAADAPEK